jgi:Flp pilus assembly protein TadG
MDIGRIARSVVRDASRGRDRGAVLVEFAIVLPVFAMLILGLFSGGMAYNNKQQITTAAREGARFGSTLHELQCSPTSNCGGSTWAQLVRSVTLQRSAGTLESANICVALVEGSGSAPVAVSAAHTTAGGTAACYADGSPDAGKRVQVVVTRQDQLEVLVFTRDLTLRARATARLEQ